MLEVYSKVELICTFHQWICVKRVIYHFNHEGHFHPWVNFLSVDVMGADAPPVQRAF